MATINANYEQQFSPLADQAAGSAGIPAAILKGVIQSESDWNPYALSSTNVYGLAQFTGSTANQYGVNRYDPASNLNGAANYLRDLFKQKGNWFDAINAYKGNNPSGTQKALDFATGKYGYTGTDTGSATGTSTPTTGSGGSSGALGLPSMAGIKNWLAGSALGVMIGFAGVVLVIGAIWALLNKSGISLPKIPA